jgi:hypothetical protein
MLMVTESAFTDLVVVALFAGAVFCAPSADAATTNPSPTQNTVLRFIVSPCFQPSLAAFSLAFLGEAAGKTELAIGARVARLAGSARPTATAAIDIRFIAIQTVVGALVQDTLVGNAIARVACAVGVRCTGRPKRAV